MSSRQLATLGLAALSWLGAPATWAQEPSAALASPESVAPDPVGVVGSPRGPTLSQEALEKRTSEVAGKLRCPVCQGLSVEASPTGSARHMRVQVRDMLARGFDEEQVLSYFEASYGEFVRLEPPLRGINWLVWLAPVAGLLVGGVFVRLAWQRLSAVPAPAPWSGEPSASATESASRSAGPFDRDALPTDPELARAVLLVRERAFGWPEGRSPASRDASEAGEGR